MNKLLILLIIPFFFLVGCREEKKPEKKSAPELTVNDLSTVMRVKWWQLKVPAGMEDKKMGIGIKEGSERIRNYGGVVGLKEGMYKVIVWGWDKDNLTYAIIGDKVSMTGDVPNPDVPDKENGVVSAIVPNGQVILPDETFFLKGAVDASLTAPVGAGQIGFCFSFEVPRVIPAEEEITIPVKSESAPKILPEPTIEPRSVLKPASVAPVKKESTLAPELIPAVDPEKETAPENVPAE